MITEKDIRKFIKDNSIPVPKDDGFMNDLIRQIDLLPVPSAFWSEEEERLQKNILLVKMIREALRKHNRRQAVKMVVMNVLIAATLFAAALFIPKTESEMQLLQFCPFWRYLAAGITTVCTLLISITKTDLLNA